MKTENKVSQKNPNWAVIGFVCIAVALLFFLPFLGTICIAALLAFLLYPLYERMSRKLSTAISVPVTLIISYLVIIIPIALIFILLLGQAIVLKDNLQAVAVTPGTSLYDETGTIITGINSLLAPLGNDAFISADSMQKFVNEVLPGLISHIIGAVLSIAGNAAQLFTAAIIYTFMFMAFLRYNKSIVNFVKSMIPFNEGLRDKYVEKSALIVTASLKGQFIISFVTAITSALLLFVLGLQNFFFFFLVLFTLLGMVPLGSGIVMIPIAIVAMLTGNFWPGFWVLAIYLLVICNIDSVLRPRLIPKKAHIIPALTTLATFCGIYYFGILGIVYGPLIVIVLTTTSEIYLASRKESVI